MTTPIASAGAAPSIGGGLIACGTSSAAGRSAAWTDGERAVSSISAEVTVDAVAVGGRDGAATGDKLAGSWRVFIPTCGSASGADKGVAVISCTGGICSNPATLDELASSCVVGLSPAAVACGSIVLLAKGDESATKDEAAGSGLNGLSAAEAATTAGELEVALSRGEESATEDDPARSGLVGSVIDGTAVGPADGPPESLA